MHEVNPELPYYVKLPYPILNKKAEYKKKDGQLKKPMENVIKHQVNVPCGESVEKMSGCSKFKNLLIRMKKPNYDEKITLTKECSAIIQRKLLPKLKYPG